MFVYFNEIPVYSLYIGTSNGNRILEIVVACRMPASDNLSVLCNTDLHYVFHFKALSFHMFLCHCLLTLKTKSLWTDPCTEYSNYIDGNHHSFIIMTGLP